MIIPRWENHNERIISMESYDKEEWEELFLLEKQLWKKYLVVADISSFFPTIYSHSIAWAILWKEVAKQTRSDSEWANILDKKSRNIKNGETNWIPIWPDTSNIISELILSQIDKELNKDYEYVRNIDDYKCYVETKEKAENFIKDLSLNLEKFQLSLNTKKTKIIELPDIINDSWVSKLRNYVLPTNIKKWEYIKIQDYLDLSITLSKEKWDFSPFKYAVKRITKIQFNDFLDYKKVLLYILWVIFNHPYIISHLDILIQKSLNKYNSVSEKEELKLIIVDFLNKVIKEHVKYSRSDIIVWAIHMSIKYKIDIDDFNNILLKIKENNDYISLVICFYYAISNSINLDIFYWFLESIDQQEWWLYVYELFNNDRENVRSIISSIKYEDFYEYLSDNQITFYIDEYLNYEPPF